MTHPLSQRILSMNESATIGMAKKARELASNGVPVISLSLGEPDFDTPAYILEGARKGMEEGYTHYPPIPGYLDLREAICRKFERENRLQFDPGQIVVSTGAKQTIANLILCLLDPGDEVIVPSPYWVSYVDIVQMAGGVSKIVDGPFEKGYKVEPEQIEAAISPKTKAIIFSSPSNPTGSVYSKEELRNLANVLSKYPNLVVISDEIYEYIIFNGQHESIAQFPEIKDQTVIVNGMSKGFAMTGWRVGYMAGPAWLSKACEKIQGQLTSATCSIAQRASLTALDGSREEVEKMKLAFRKRRDLVFEELSKIDGIETYLPDGAFYMLPKIDSLIGRPYKGRPITDETDFCMTLLNDFHVSTVTGLAFGAPNTFRISFAASTDELLEAIRRIRSFVNELN